MEKLLVIGVLVLVLGKTCLIKKIHYLNYINHMTNIFYSMEQMVEQGIRSVILTSGTLSPLKPFISELGIPITVQLENPHIITKEQVCVGVLSQGPDNHPLNSSYNTR